MCCCGCKIYSRFCVKFTYIFLQYRRIHAIPSKHTNQYSLLNDIPLPSDNVSTPIENLVFNNFRILHLTRSTSYNILAFLEALLIKYNNPQLNTGLKASKELQLFT